MNVSTSTLRYARRTYYHHSDTLASAAIFVPPAGTVVMLAVTLSGAEDLVVTYAGDAITGGAKSFRGTIYCDGVYTGFANGNASNAVLILDGVTL